MLKSRHSGASLASLFRSPSDLMNIGAHPPHLRSQEWPSLANCGISSCRVALGCCLVHIVGICGIAQLALTLMDAAMITSSLGPFLHLLEALVKEAMDVLSILTPSPPPETPQK